MGRRSRSTSILPATARKISTPTSKAAWVQATIPSSTKVGVVVHASGGLGSINAHGLKHDGE